MEIKQHSKILLFRFSNYKRISFIEAHKKVLLRKKYVWMLKVGKKASKSKLESIIDDGGWMVLRAPKADGGVSFIARFTEVTDCKPKNNAFPDYYNEFLHSDVSFDYDMSSEQWFKLDYIEELSEKDADCFTLEKTGKSVNDVIGTTRTAFMYITNERHIEL